VRKPKEKKIRNKDDYDYLGFKNDSMSEKWTLMWLECLLNEGFIENIQRADNFHLTDAVYKKYHDVLKTKTNIKEEPLLQSSSYTPDFEFDITPKGQKLSLFKEIDTLERCFKRSDFTFITQNNHCIIEVKGTKFGGKNSTLAEFVYKQKFTYQKYGVYVNLVTPDKLFPLTFCSPGYLLSPIKQIQRKIKFKIVHFQDWLKQQKIN